MPIRTNSFPNTRYGVPGVRSGYESQPAEDLHIPPVGLVDVDKALFNLFEKEIDLRVTTKSDSDESSGDTKKVPVILAGGEKWVKLKKNKALRDKNGTLILPLVSILRTNISQTPTDDFVGRGISQHTGELVIERRLSDKDRSYQSIVNRLLLQNQSNIATSDGDLTLNPIVTRDIGDLSSSELASSGGLLKGDRRKNIYEFITVPSPQFYTMMYEVTLWAQYTRQMNEMIEAIMASFLQQGNQNWRIDTENGYWFIASVDGNTFNAQNNFDEMSSDERLIKYQFSVKVPAYSFATLSHGKPVPVRRHISAPTIDFNVADPAEEISFAGIDDPYLGSDDPTLPLNVKNNRRDDQRNDQSTTLYPDTQASADPSDPALRGRVPVKYRKITAIDQNGEIVVKYVKIQRVNKHTGEVIYARATDLGGLNIISIE